MAIVIAVNQYLHLKAPNYSTGKLGVRLEKLNYEDYKIL